MRILLIPILLLFSLFVNAQLVETKILVPTVADASQHDSALLKLPNAYASTTRTYPTIFYFHGSGSGHSPLSNLYNSPDGGIPTQLEHSGWDGTAVNPATGIRDSFIVVSPQDNTGWSSSAQQILYIKAYIISHYRVDVNRIYFTGISAGGEGLVNYVTGFGMSSGPNGFPAATVPMSYAEDYFPTSTDGHTFVNDSVPVWGFGDSVNDIHGLATAVLTYRVNAAKSGYARFTNYSGGHCCWGNFYVATYTEHFTWNGTTATMNIYQWMLLNSRSSGSPPVANAGSDQTITLPTNSVVLDGSGSTGTITSYTWTQLSGPNTGTIVTPNNVTTTVSGLIAGTYKFQLSLNAGVSLDTVQVTVNPQGSHPACGSRIKYVIGTSSDGFISGDTAFFLNASADNTYKPGDTLDFGNSTPIPRWKYIEIDSFSGNPSCPLVITYTGTQCLVENLSGDTTNGHNGTINLVTDSYVKVDGNKNVPGVYGFLIQGDPVLRYDLGAGAQVVGKSHNIEWTGTKIRNIGTALWMKNNGDCNLIDNYPNPGVDSVFFHDNWIVGTWNEGMYIGNTSPDNAPSGACAYDMRPITCDDTTFFPVPPRIGDIYIYNNIVDSTGRGGIQLAGASVGTSYIYNNTVTHNGMNGDDAQGTAISVGTYSRVIIHDNNCRTTYTWAIALLGASNTGFAQQIYNNITDSSGYNKWYNLATTSRTWINPATEPIFTDTLIWPQSIFVDTKPTCNPVDSTIVWIKNNTLKLCKRPSQQIIIQNDYHTLQNNGGNIICNNLTATGSLASIYLDPTATGFNYSINCAAPNNYITIPIGVRPKVVP
jgi:hypothetical protein